MSDEPSDVFVPELTDELDLHTFLPREVPALVREYLDACAGRFAVVRIIHGKGTGALLRTVHAILKSHPRVDSFALAPPDRGGWGATFVRLKQG